jgi:hypothetical protein
MARSKPASQAADGLTQWRKAYGAFRPDEALPSGDDRYVDFSAERGSAGLIATMANNIRLDESGRSCQLLCGHRGGGKTTEINHLLRDLRTQAPPYFVVYCEADTYLDLNDTEYPDVLLALARQSYLDCLQEGIDLSPGKVQALADLVKGLWRVVSPTKVKVRAGVLDFDFDIQKNPDNRHKVREHLRPRATPFLEAINEVIRKARDEFSGKYAGLVVVMDNLDRIFRNALPGAGQTNHDALFIDASDYLKGLECHVVYTIPPALLYSLNNGPKLGTLYGGEPHLLPMIPVTRRTGEEDEGGMKRLEEALEKRLRRAGGMV